MKELEQDLQHIEVIKKRLIEEIGDISFTKAWARMLVIVHLYHQLKLENKELKRLLRIQSKEII